MKYVAGLLFSTEGERVALIHKDHGPAAVVGRWNAIGGKCSTGSAGQPESPDSAIWREFLEEAGVDVSWTLFLILKGDDWEVHFFHAFNGERLSQVRTVEREVVNVFRVGEVLDPCFDPVPNLRWIIPMALGHKNDHVWVYEVREKETFLPFPVGVEA